MVVDDEGDEYVRPYKRLAEDRDSDQPGLHPPVSHVSSNNPAHTTKKKGRKNSKFTTHETIFWDKTMSSVHNSVHICRSEIVLY